MSAAVPLRARVCVYVLKGVRIFSDEIDCFIFLLKRTPFPRASDHFAVLTAVIGAY